MNINCNINNNIYYYKRKKITRTEIRRGENQLNISNEKKIKLGIYTMFSLVKIYTQRQQFRDGKGR